MEKRYVNEINVETGEELLREYTKEEYEQYEIDKKMLAESREQEKLKQASRESALAKLAALGLTEDEIAAL